MSGQVIHSKKEPSKVRFRVHRYFRVRGMEEMISDAVDFDKEEEAIDFMLQCSRRRRTWTSVWMKML
jgi:hypothetical protein